VLLCASDTFAQRYFGHSGSSPDDTHTPIILDTQDNDKLIEDEYKRRESHPDQPIQFASKISQPINIVTRALWEYTDDNLFVGKLRLHSPDAYSINVFLSHFKIGQATTVNLYNPVTGYSHREFTESDVESHQQLWSPIVKGDHLMIEIVTTEEDRDNLDIQLESVFHDYIGFDQVFERGVSGSCNVDVACGAADGYPEVDQFRQQISSVGAYHFNGQEVCSGVAINNTEQDCTPYFLTANHCGISPATAASMVVYWNYENSYCRQPDSTESGQNGDGSLSQYNTGAIFRAKELRSDFALVELDDPIDPGYQVYLSGWYRGTDLPETTIAIHHPSVAEKRISFDYDLPEIDYTSVSLGYRLRVLGWDLGSTEAGSSGCPIFNQDGLVVGQLVGGTASCDNDEWDLFGWFHKSWDGNNSNTTRLKDWLDPRGENIEELAGHTCSYQVYYEEEEAMLCSAQEDDHHQISILANAAFDQSAMLEIVDDAGLDLSLLVTQLDHNSNAILQVNNVHQLDQGDYSIKLGITNQNVDIDLDVGLQVSEDNPSQPSLISPGNNLASVGSSMTFRWQNALGVNQYDFLLASDQAFGQILALQEVLDDNSVTLTNLSPNKTYFWKVKGYNTCGESEWSSVRSFNTEFEFCTKIIKADPVTIDETTNVYYYNLQCDHDVNIKSLQIDNIRGTHAYVSDLYFWINKGLQQAFLWGGGCGSAQDYSIGFNIDNSNTPSCPIADGRIYRPAQTYAGLFDSNAKGQWQIRVEDKEVEDGGTIDQAVISICFDEAYDDVIVPETNLVFVCEEEIELDLYSNIASRDDIQFAVADQLNHDVPFRLKENQSADNGIYHISIDKSDLDGLEEIKLKAFSDEKSVEAEVRLMSGESSQPNAITYPMSEQVISDEMELQFQLENIPELATELQIATDPDFYDILYTTTIIDSDVVEVEMLVTPDRQYYARTLNSDPFRSCRGVSETITFYGSPISDIDQLASQSFSISPNPANDIIHIALDDAKSQMSSVSLYTMTGELVMNQSISNLSENNAILDVSHLSTGIYMVRVQLDDQTNLIQKVSVQ
jgi:hypothetical protein